MNQKKICIRVDSNDEIATGHLMRCLSIALALKELGCAVVFITADNWASKRIIEKGYEQIVLNTCWCNLELEVEKLLKVIINKFDIMLLDSYAVTSKYMKEIKKHVKLVYIDDIYKFEYPCDLLINYTNYYKKMQYCHNQDRKMLLGTSYVPLRPEFANFGKRFVSEKMNSIVFLSGGADKYNMAVWFVQKVVMRNRFSKRKFVVICGEFSKSIDWLKKTEEKLDNLQVIVQTTEIYSIMLEADIVITAAGTALYELCACGTPAISYIVADNQIENALSFQEEMLIPCVGDVRTNIEKCVDEIYLLLIFYEENPSVRQEIIFKMKGKVDGLGSVRIAKMMVENL